MVSSIVSTLVTIFPTAVSLRSFAAFSTSKPCLAQVTSWLTWIALTRQFRHFSGDVARPSLHILGHNFGRQNYDTRCVYQCVRQWKTTKRRESADVCAWLLSRCRTELKRTWVVRFWLLSSARWISQVLWFEGVTVRVLKRHHRFRYLKLAWLGIGNVSNGDSECRQKTLGSQMEKFYMVYDLRYVVSFPFRLGVRSIRLDTDLGN